MFIFVFDLIMQTMDFILIFSIPKKVQHKKIDLTNSIDAMSYTDRLLYKSQSVQSVVSANSLVGSEMNTLIGVEGDSNLGVRTKQEKEFWQYVRLQMLWNSIIGFLCGLYELMLGVIGVFILDFLNLQEWFGLKCIEGLTTLAVWDEPTKFPGEAFSVLHTVIIIMYSTLQYIVFYVIPFKFNRLKKTPKEVLFLILLL